MAQDAKRLEDEQDSAPIPSEVRRSRRKRAVKPRTQSMKRLSRRDLEIGRALYPADELDDVARPRTRGDCAEGPRPCPFVACVHHLYLDVSARTGAIKLNFPDLEPDQLVESCSLDVAGRFGASLEEVGTAMNLTRERIRQMEVRGLAKIAASKQMFLLRDFVEVGVVAKRKLPVLQERNEEPGFDVDHFASDELDAE